ncbi:MAG: 50S ribosomal protein L17 [Bacteroidetes bacterium]|nr:50S ribosomal protein L17 [Bacteroidota bacterium]
MRHRKGFNHLSRTKAHREAMFANMASSLILHKRIQTTTAKAKALRTYVEPLITKSKSDTTHSRRVVFSYLKNKYAVSELFREVSPKIAERPGGYTRILKTGSRLGDNAEMCIIELVDYNENLLTAKEDKKTKRSRTRRGSKGSSETPKEMPETQIVEDKELKTEPDDNNEKAGKEEKEPEKVKTEENLKAEETEDVKVEKESKQNDEEQKSENDIVSSERNDD